MLRYGRIVVASIYRSRGLKFGTLPDDFVSANLEVVDVCRFIGEPSVFFHIKAMEIMIVTWCDWPRTDEFSWLLGIVVRLEWNSFICLVSSPVVQYRNIVLILNESVVIDVGEDLWRDVSRIFIIFRGGTNNGETVDCFIVD